MSMSCSCGQDLDHNELHDAYFCAKCNKWTEDKCNDSNCFPCRNRPEFPLVSEKMTCLSCDRCQFIIDNADFDLSGVRTPAYVCIACGTSVMDSHQMGVLRKLIKERMENKKERKACD